MLTRIGTIEMKVESHAALSPESSNFVNSI